MDGTWFACIINYLITTSLLQLFQVCFSNFKLCFCAYFFCQKYMRNILAGTFFGESLVSIRKYLSGNTKHFIRSLCLFCIKVLDLLKAVKVIFCMGRQRKCNFTCAGLKCNHFWCKIIRNANSHSCESALVTVETHCKNCKRYPMLLFAVESKHTSIIIDNHHQSQPSNIYFWCIIRYANSKLWIYILHSSKWITREMHIE